MVFTHLIYMVIGFDIINIKNFSHYNKQSLEQVSKYLSVETFRSLLEQIFW